MKTYGELLFDNKVAKMHLHVAEALLANSMCLSKFTWQDSTGKYKPTMWCGKVEWHAIAEVEQTEYKYQVMLYSNLTIEADTQEEADAQVHKLFGECGKPVDVVELQNHNMEFIVHLVMTDEGEEVLS